MSLSLSGRISSLARSSLSWRIPWPWWLEITMAHLGNIWGELKSWDTASRFCKLLKTKAERGGCQKHPHSRLSLLPAQSRMCEVHSPVCGQDLRAARSELHRPRSTGGGSALFIPSVTQKHPVYKWLGAAPNRSLFGFRFRPASL